MQYIYYPLAAIALYFLSDWILLKIEVLRGEPFKQQRSTVFLLIIMILAVSSFKAIEVLIGG
jgi:hypothetical protein